MIDDAAVTYQSLAIMSSRDVAGNDAHHSTRSVRSLSAANFVSPVSSGLFRVFCFSQPRPAQAGSQKTKQK